MFLGFLDFIFVIGLALSGLNFKVFKSEFLGLGLALMFLGLNFRV
jgi:hypothetical protein